MKISGSVRTRRLATVVGAVVVSIVGFAFPAAAHTPVLLDSTDTVPSKSPLAVNGDNPIAFFGVLPAAGADRAFQFNMTAGQTVNLTTLVPDLAPENALPSPKLPNLLVIAPDGKTTAVTPNMRVAVPIPELDENYLLIDNYTAPAKTGRYSVIVTGLAASRFNVSIGTEGGPFDGILRGSVATVDQIKQWYATPPQ